MYVCHKANKRSIYLSILDRTERAGIFKKRRRDFGGGGRDLEGEILD